MMLFNPGSATVNYTIYYTPGGMDGTMTPYIYSNTLNPQESPLLMNIVETLFNLTYASVVDNRTGDAIFIPAVK